MEVKLSDEKLREPEYTDEQFYTDLKKAGKQLDIMEQQALEEYAQGKTREFLVC